MSPTTSRTADATVAALERLAFARMELSRQQVGRGMSADDRAGWAELAEQEASLWRPVADSGLVEGPARALLQWAAGRALGAAEDSAREWRQRERDARSREQETSGRPA